MCSESLRFSLIYLEISVIVSVNTDKGSSPNFASNIKQI